MTYRRTPRRSPLVTKLAPVAVTLLKTYADGVTTADLIEAAINLGVLTGEESHKELSGIGHVFRAAGGVNSGETRCSHLEGQKGVRQTVWVRSPYRDS
jgi:hypothetical protein